MYISNSPWISFVFVLHTLKFQTVLIYILNVSLKVNHKLWTSLKNTFEYLTAKRKAVFVRNTIILKSVNCKLAYKNISKTILLLIIMHICISMPCYAFLTTLTIVVEQEGWLTSYDSSEKKSSLSSIFDCYNNKWIQRTPVKKKKKHFRCCFIGY